MNSWSFPKPALPAVFLISGNNSLKHLVSQAKSQGVILQSIFPPKAYQTCNLSVAPSSKYSVKNSHLSYPWPVCSVVWGIVPHTKRLRFNPKSGHACMGGSQWRFLSVSLPTSRTPVLSLQNH